MDGYYSTLRLYNEKPEYIPIVKKCVEAHHLEITIPHHLGFEWNDAEVMPIILTLLVTKYGILEVTYKSNSSTCYMVRNIENVEKALSYIDSQKAHPPDEGTVIRIWLSMEQRNKLRVYIERELPGDWDPESIVLDRALNEFLDRNVQFGDNSGESEDKPERTG